MSTLSMYQMIQEATGPINERFRYINERMALDRCSGFEISYDPSFEFVASDGHTLGVKFFNNPNPKVAAEFATTTEQQFYTVITKTGHLTNYPCLVTGRGDIIFVHDPAVTCADKIFHGYGRFDDPQEWWHGQAREVRNKTVEHVPRPMNAFIIYRNAQMATVRQQNPGIGNNDVSRIIGKKWRALDPASRAHYKGLAARSAQEHQAKHPGYKYTPRKPEDVIRRRKRPFPAQKVMHNRNPRIHHNIDSVEPPPTPLHYLIPGFPNLDKLTSAWAEEPTAIHFEALMNGFDCALGLAKE